MIKSLDSELKTCFSSGRKTNKNMMTKGKTLNKINEFIVLLIIRLARRELAYLADFFLLFFFPGSQFYDQTECLH